MPWERQGAENLDRLTLDFLLFFLSHFQARGEKKSQLALHVTLKSYLGAEFWNPFWKGSWGEWSGLVFQVLAEWQLLAPRSSPGLRGLFVQRLELTCLTTVEQMLLQTQLESEGAFQKWLFSSEKVQLDYQMGSQRWQWFQGFKTLYSLNISC